MTRSAAVRKGREHPVAHDSAMHATAERRNAVIVWRGL